MELATMIVAGAIALLSVALRFIAAPIKRMMTHDIRLVFRGGNQVTIAIKPDTSEPEIVQQIDNALTNVLLARSAWRKPVNARRSGNKMRSIQKNVSARSSTIEGGEHFRKIVRLKHVEAWFLDKQNTRAEQRERASGHWDAAHVTTKMTEGALHRVKSTDWMRKHDEVLPISGEA
jgi:hypothetical protein